MAMRTNPTSLALGALVAGERFAERRHNSGGAVEDMLLAQALPALQDWLRQRYVVVVVKGSAPYVVEPRVAYASKPIVDMIMLMRETEKLSVLVTIPNHGPVRKLIVPPAPNSRDQIELPDDRDLLQAVNAL